MWQAWTIVISGFWLFLSAFLSFPAMGNMWNDLIVGALVGIAGLDMSENKPWLGWVSSILGLWLIATAFAPNIQAPEGSMWNGIIVGGLLLFVGLSARFGIKMQGKHQVAH